MADDDVQLTDLEVIQQFSLAVRGATAPRADVIAALEADLAYLGGSRRAAPAKVSVEKAAVERAPVPPRPTAKAPVKTAAKAPVKAASKAPVKAAAKKAPAKTTRAHRA
jgi:hypothetical protein